MTRCQEIGRWIQETIEKPVERFFEDAYQACEDVRRWVRQEVRRPIETWRRREEERCRKEECVWLCLCCNKWLCTLVTVLVRVIEWVIEVVFEWLTETICRIIVTIIRFVVMVIIQILKWVVITMVCIFEALCRALIVLAALAILLALLCLAGLPIAVLAPALLPLAAPALVTAVSAMGLIWLLCEVSRCRFFRIIGWAFMWATLLAGAMALFYLSIGTGLFMALCGGTTAAISIALERINCTLPRLFSWP
jgi:hypothetical protein